MTGIILLFSDTGMTIIQHQDLSNQTSVNYLKLMQLFSGVGLFITPVLLYAYLTNFDFKFDIDDEDAFRSILIRDIMIDNKFFEELE